MDEIQKAIQGARNERLNHMYNSFSNLKEVEKDETAIRKADDVEDDSKKDEEDEKEVKKQEVRKVGEAADGGEETDEEADDDKAEKADIMYAMSGADGIKISKTGKEIKEQVDSVILPELNSALAVKESEATEKLKDCGAAPTKDVCSWWTGDVKMDVGYKMYDWRETEWYQNDNRMYPSLSASDEAEKKGNLPTSQAEANARNEYNEIVRTICNIKVDIKACEILKNLKDNSQYELTPRQVLTLKF